MISRSGTTTSDFIASEVLTDSEEEPSDTEEIEVPKKMSGRYREVQKPTPFKESLLKQITPDPVTGMNVISQTKMREGVHQGSTPGDSFQKLEVSAIQQDSSPSNSDEKTTENDDDKLSPLQDVNEDSNRMSPTTYATAVSGLEEVTKGMQDIDLKGSDDSVTIHTSGMSNAVKSDEELRAEHDKDFTLVTKVKGNSRAVLNKKKARERKRQQTTHQSMGQTVCGLLSPAQKSSSSSSSNGSSSSTSTASGNKDQDQDFHQAGRK